MRAGGVLGGQAGESGSRVQSKGPEAGVWKGRAECFTHQEADSQGTFQQHLE